MSYNPKTSLYSIDPREALQQLMKERGVTYTALSIMLGRARAYLQQYVGRGAPKRLSDRDCKFLADFFGVDEEVLGGAGMHGSQTMVAVPRLGVQASAGAGSEVDNEFKIGAYRFDASWLRGLSRAKPEFLSIIRVSGDSMAPTLDDGDDVLVDRSATLRDGIYVLRRDDTLMVKRLGMAPTSNKLTISSDNPAYPTFSDVPTSEVAVIGRVVWSSRKHG